MIDQGKHNLLGIRIDAVDYERAVARIMGAALERRFYGVSALAVHGVMTGVLDTEHRYRLNHLDLVVPDGQPVRWGLNWLYRLRLRERVYGPELTLRVCTVAATEDVAVYFYGSRAEVLEKLQTNLLRLVPDLTIAGAEPSRFRRLTPQEKDETVSRIRASGARIVFVGLGCPRQEVFAYEFTRDLSIPVVAVGAAFDFHAGTLAQAPPWMGRLGLEWLYRLMREPRRLAGRYLILNPWYLYLLTAQKIRLRKFDPAKATRPKTELLWG